VIDATPSVREVCVTLWRSRTFRHLLLCFALASFFSSGIGQWQPTFLIRSFGLKTGELGTWFAAISGIGGLVGTFAGGELASRRAANNERLQLLAIAAVYSASAVALVLSLLSSSHYLAFGFIAFTVVAGAAASGPLFATIQTLVPGRMRATAIALIFLFANLVGMGLGPLLVGILSDALRARFGEESLRYALLTLCPGYLWAALHLWWGSRTVTADLALQLHKVRDELEPAPATAATKT
jgi:MFS family permease